MTDVTFLMLAIAFVLVAFLSSVATLNAPPTDSQLDDLWQLCRCPNLSSAGGLVLFGPRGR
jgi:hypothetical protein